MSSGKYGGMPFEKRKYYGCMEMDFTGTRSSLSSWGNHSWAAVLCANEQGAPHGHLAALGCSPIEAGIESRPTSGRAAFLVQV